MDYGKLVQIGQSFRNNTLDNYLLYAYTLVLELQLDNPKGEEVYFSLLYRSVLVI